MCSIAGLTSIGADQLVNGREPREALGRMVRALRHRGPDDQGVWVSTATLPATPLTVGLANTRLAILDLSPSGHQPMTNNVEGLSLTYNGECYNYLELRRELGEPAGGWRSRTDTEVVLRAYERWGVASFGKLRGMFALALWDARRRSLILARDPFGIKPLYYYRTDKLFVFASELRALLASGLVPHRLSGAGLVSYLRAGAVASPETILEDVRSLPPGHFMMVEPRADGTLATEEIAYAEDLFGGGGALKLASRGEAVELLRTTLEESVRLHLTSDVPLGLFLSGGIDSSALVALMSRVTRERPKTFSVVFAEKKFTEAAHAGAVAEKFKAEHHEILLSGRRLLELLPGAIGAADQPTMDGVNTYVVSKAVREAGITVALSGLGGDELFAGYPTFRRALRMRQVARVPRPLRRGVAAVGGAFFNHTVQRKKFWRLLASDADAAATYAISRELFPEPAALLSDGEGFTSVKSGTACGAKLPLPAQDPINAVSVYELRGYMANTLLRDTDCMSMAHSLEVRVPFVDVEIVRFVLGLPGAWKLNGGRPKPLLQDALGDLLPPEVAHRPKMGFTLPFENWMQSRLRDEIETTFADEIQFSAIGLQPKAVREVWRRFLHAPQRVGWSRPWALHVLGRWCAQHRVTL